MNFIQIITARIKSQTPDFFKKLRAIFTWIGSACVAMLVAKQFLSSYGFVLPADVIQYLGYTTILCAGVVGTSFLTTNDPNLAQK